MILYEVYEDPGGLKQCGLAVADVAAQVVTLCDGVVTVKTMDPTQVGSFVAGLLRKGYRRLQGGRYLAAGTARSVFTTTHPDLIYKTSGVHKPTLYAAIPAGVDLTEQLGQWSALAQSSWRLSALERWLEKAATARTYLAAFDDHPAATLLVGQWARSGGLALLATKGNPPDGAPKDAPLEWTAYLSQWFDVQQVQQSQRVLSWTALDMYQVAATPLSTGDTGDDWLTHAGPAIF